MKRRWYLLAAMVWAITFIALSAVVEHLLSPIVGPGPAILMSGFGCGGIGGLGAAMIFGHADRVAYREWMRQFRDKSEEGFKYKEPY